MEKTFEDFGIQIPYGKHSGKAKCFCPNCHDSRRDKKDKSLSVDIDKGVWNCHYCGFKGSLHVPDRDESPEAKRRWMESQAWYNPDRIRRRQVEYRKPEQRPHGEWSMSEKALKWFASRCISSATLKEMNVTEGMEFMPQNGKPSNTVQFNYYLNGELVNTKFRTGDKKFKMVQGARLIPYNIDAVRGRKECIITEGEMDALSFYEVGRHDVVSVPNGANSNLEWLDDFMESHFEDKETIYIASDSDTKGVLLRDELVRRFGADVCRVLEYGDGCKDANEHLQKYGRESLLKVIADAPEMKIDGVYRVRDFEDDLDVLFDNGWQKGFTIGHDNFDRLCSFETKRLLIVTGIPSSGKSEFIDEIAVRLNILYGWKFAYFSPENAPPAYHTAKLSEKLVGKRFGRATMMYGEYAEAKRYIDDNFFFILPDDGYSLSNILVKARFLVRRKGIRAVVIDPYNRLEDESDGRSETRYISKQLDDMTNFAQQNDVLLILMAHPTKMHRDKEGNMEVPTLYDISGSANFYNKADFGIVVNRKRNEDCVEIKVSKVKFRHLGENGDALFKYNVNNGRYVPYEIGRTVNWDNSNYLREGIPKNADSVRDVQPPQEAVSKYAQAVQSSFFSQNDDDPFGGDYDDDAPF